MSDTVAELGGIAEPVNDGVSGSDVGVEPRTKRKYTRRAGNPGEGDTVDIGNAGTDSGTGNDSGTGTVARARRGRKANSAKEAPLSINTIALIVHAAAGAVAARAKIPEAVLSEDEKQAIIKAGADVAAFYPVPGLTPKGEAWFKLLSCVGMIGYGHFMAYKMRLESERRATISEAV